MHAAVKVNQLVCENLFVLHGKVMRDKKNTLVELASSLTGEPKMSFLWLLCVRSLMPLRGRLSREKNTRSATARANSLLGLPSGSSVIAGCRLASTSDLQQATMRMGTHRQATSELSLWNINIFLFVSFVIMYHLAPFLHTARDNLSIHWEMLRQIWHKWLHQQSTPRK